MSEQTPNYKALIKKGNIAKEISINDLLPFGHQDSNLPMGYVTKAISYPNLVTQLTKDVHIAANVNLGLGGTLALDNTTGANNISVDSGQSILFTDANNYVTKSGANLQLVSDVGIMSKIGPVEMLLNATGQLVINNINDDETFTIDNSTGHITYNTGLGYDAQLRFGDLITATRNWTLPNASGTIALTTDAIISGGIDVTISDSDDIIIGTTTGTKIGTATTQKIGFWNATPVVQQAHVADVVGTASGTDATIIDALVVAVNAINAKDAALGLTAAS